MAKKLRGLVIRVFFILCLCAIWYGVARDSPAIPGPLEVLGDAASLLQDGSVVDILVSVRRVALALVISSVCGVVLGLLSARVPVLNLLLNSTVVPLIEAMPPLIWTVICILVIGLGEITVLFVICVILTQFFVVNTIEGCKNIDMDLMEMGRSFPLGYQVGSRRLNFRGRIRILRYLEMGMLTPYLLTATRLAFGVAWKVIVIAEMFGASTGIGYLINEAYSTLRITRLASLALVTLLLFFVIDSVVIRPVEKRLRECRGS